MAVVLEVDGDGQMHPEAFLEKAVRQIDCNDLNSVLALVPDFRRVANNKRVLLDKFNQEIRQAIGAGTSFYSQASLMIAGKRGDSVYLRANIWPSIDDTDPNAAEVARLYSYDAPHDHNFSFLTANYLGPGYETDLFKYDYQSVRGEIGESVQMEFASRETLGPSTIMFYESGRDVHTQFPPSQLSVSLNLMIYSPEDRLRDQFLFNTEQKKISGFTKGTVALNRAAVIGMAACVGDATTQDLLWHILRVHGCRRARAAAATALAKLVPNDREYVANIAMKDSEAVVRTAGMALIQDSAAPARAAQS